MPTIQEMPMLITYPTVEQINAKQIAVTYRGPKNFSN